MPFSRRGFLAATGATLLAGCNDAESPSREETVTPVDVPLSGDAALVEAADVEVPAIPSAVIVSDEHQADLVARAEGLVETADEAAESADDVDVSNVWGSLQNPENVFGRAREAVETLRESRSRREYRRAIGQFDDVGTVLGYVRAETDELDLEAVRGALGREQAAFDALRDRFEYRFRAPVDRFLPTITAAESGIERAGSELSQAEREVGGLDPGPEAVTSQDIAGAWSRIEQLRLRKTNAAGFARTAVDPSAPLRRDTVTDLLGTQLDEVASLELLRGEDTGTVDVPRRIRSIVSTVRSRRSQLLRDADPGDPANPSTGEILFNSLQVRAEIEAFGAAGEVTFELLERDTFPGERLVSEKQEAVRQLETLAAAAPLPRRLGRLAEDMITFGDRLQSSVDGDPVATAFFVYVAAQEYADLALERGEMLASALEAPDDSSPGDDP